MKPLFRTTILVSLLAGFTGHAQTSIPALKEDLIQHAPETGQKKQEKIVIITGNRFSYPLVQKWIDDYNSIKPSVQIIIESRGASDPSQYDILSEVYEQDEEVKKSRQYVYVARYAILPVANSKSAFAKTYAEKGLSQGLINQLFFHDIYADKENVQEIKVPFTVYTRLQKAGAPIVFTKYFGYEQKDIKGKAIAGSDEHLLKAIVRDSTGVSYLPLPLIYDRTTKKPISGLTVLPVDLNGNGRLNDDEKFYADLTGVVQHLEGKEAKDFKNIPIGYLHLSIDKGNTNPEAIEFLNWVIQNGHTYLEEFGYLKPEPGRFTAEKIEQLSSKRAK
jgi:ABC-type phosphate transport system substrate-binding protein